MTISSARPEALDHAAAGLSARGKGLRQALDAVWTAANAYADHCHAAPVDLASPGRARQTAEHGRRLHTDLRRVADAFRAADSGSRIDHRGLTVLTDLTLSATILLHHPSLDRSLTEPSRDLRRHATELATELIAMSQTEGIERAMALLEGLPRAVLSDPSFAAAFINTIGARRLESMVEELTLRSLDWKERFGAMADLARLWTTATRTLDRPTRPHHLDGQILSSLLSSASGRNTLRALAGGSDLPAGSRYLRQVLSPLLLDGAERDRSQSNTYRFLLGLGRQGHPDAAMLDAASRVPDIAVEVFLGGVGGGTAGVEARTRRLLDMGPSSHVAVANLLAQVLDHQRFSPSTHSRDRAAILRASYSWVVDNGPQSVTEPLAQFLAETLHSDIDFYLARVDTARRGDLALALQAVTEHERPWMTALLAFERHGVRLVQGSLHRGTAARTTALHGLSRVEDAFEEAAEFTDRPRDRARGMFTALTTVADVVFSATSMSPATRVVGKQLTTTGLNAWHRATVEDPDDHADRTRIAREGLRRRVWTVIAHDPELGRQIDWAVGGTGSERDQHLGSQIRGVDDLVGLTPSDADLDELAAWADAQPEELKTIVDSFMVGAT